MDEKEELIEKAHKAGIIDETFYMGAMVMLEPT
jgi:hypothetical protein